MVTDVLSSKEVAALKAATSLAATENVAVPEEKPKERKTRKTRKAKEN